MRHAVLSASLVSACGAAPAPSPPANTPVGERDPAPTCREREIWRGAVAEAVQVAADDRYVYWQGYNFGQVWRSDRSGDGPPVEVIQGSDEVNVQSWVVERGLARWGSKGQMALYEAQLDASAPEARQVHALDVVPFTIAVVDDVVYAAGFQGGLAWWSPTLGGGERVVAGAGFQIASGPDGLYVGTDTGVVRLRSPAATAEPVALDGLVGLDFQALNIEGRWLWASFEAEAGGALAAVDRSNGEGWTWPISSGSLNIAPHPSGAGAVVDVDDHVAWFSTDGGEPVELARYPGEWVTDLVISGESLFISTYEESSGDNIVRERCLTLPR